MKQKIGYIYKHQNKVNGKIYIGKTTQKPSRRFNKTNFNGYRSDSGFGRAIRKYGWDAFETEMILTVLDTQLLSECEEYFIKYFNSLTPNGYNLISYSEGQAFYSDETKQRISNSRKKYLKSLTKPLIAVNKQDHIIIDNIEYKHCPLCNTNKQLFDFYSNKSRWDNLHTYCKICSTSYTNKYRKNNISTDKTTRNFVTHTETTRKLLSKINSQEIQAKHIITKEVKRFKSATEAVSLGLGSASRISWAIKNKKIYNNYLWEKVNSDTKNQYIIDQKYLIFNIELKDPKKSLIWDSIRNPNKIRIGARNCSLRKIEQSEYKQFCIDNHLQGYVPASYVIGLLHDNILVSLMSFSKPRYNSNYEWELMRFCSLTNHTITGGASRLLKCFIEDSRASSIISYANLRFSQGDLYEKLGFTKIGKSQPNYFYIKSDIIYSRIKFQKHKLSKLLDNYDPNLTEKENMLNNGYQIIKDRGNLVYVWKAIDKN